VDAKTLPYDGRPQRSRKTKPTTFETLTSTEETKPITFETLTSRRSAQLENSIPEPRIYINATFAIRDSSRALGFSPLCLLCYDSKMYCR
jgi:hypothetical protein